LRILDRHILREFVLFSGMGLVAFVGIYVIVNLFEKIDVFVDHKAPVLLVARYYLLGIPLFTLQVLPLALLLGSILSLGQLKKWGELTAMQVAGSPPLRILYPMLALGAVLAVVSFVVGEELTPGMAQARKELYEGKIRGRRDAASGDRSDLILLGRGGRIYLAFSYDHERKLLRRVSVQHPRADSQELDWRVDAAAARWQDGVWMFSEGNLRRFLQGGEEISCGFARFADSRLLERPEDFAKPQGEPLFMSRKSLDTYIRRLREGGGRVHKYEVDYHIRGSFPLANLIMILLGGVLSMRIRKGGNIALAIGITLFLGFTYLAFIRLGQALGYHGTVPPLLAAWMGNATFGGIGVFLLWRVHR
jgi:lipopolysaccharide export system permease protein